MADVQIGKAFIEVSAHTEEADADIRRIQEKADGTKAKIKADAETEKAEEQLDKTARERTSKIKAEVDTSSAKDSATQLGTIFGGIGQGFKIAAFTELPGVMLAGVQSALTLGQSLAQVAGVGVMLPGVMLGAAAGIGVLKMAFADTSKYVTGLDKDWQSVHDTVSKNFWHEAAEPMAQLANDTIPQLRTGLGSIATTMGSTFATVANTIKQSFAGGALTTTLDMVRQGFENASKGAASLTGGISGLFQISSGYLPALGTWIGNASDKLGNFLQKVNGDGTLQKWADDGINQIKVLGSVVGDVGKILGGIFKAADAAGGTSLQMLADGLGKVAAIVNGPAFQAGLTGLFSGASAGAKALFDGLGKALGDLGPALAMLGPLLGQIGAVGGQILQALGPVVLELVASLSPALKTILTAVQPLIPILGTVLTEAIHALAPVFGVLADAVAKAVPFISGLLQAITPLIPSIAPLAATILPIVLNFGKLLPILQFLTGPLGILIGLFTLAYTQSAPFRDAINKLVTTLGELVTKVASALMPVFQQLISTAMPPLIKLFDALAPIITKVADIVVQLVSAALPPLISIFNAVIPVIGNVITAITPIISLIGDVLIGVINALMPVVSTVFNAIADIIKSAMEIVQGIIDVVTGIISGNWDQVWKGIQEILKGVWDTIVSVISGVLNTIGSLIQAGLDFVSHVFSSIWDGIVGFVRDGINNVMNFFRDLPQNIVNALSGLGGMLGDVGKNMIQGLIDGVKNMAGAVVGAISGVVNGAIDGAKALLGIHSPSRVFHEIGVFTSMGMSEGLDASQDIVKKSMANLIAIPDPDVINVNANLAGSRVNSTLGSNGPAAQSNVTQHINVTIDAKNVKDFNSVVELFTNITQTARTGRSSAQVRIA